MYKSKKQQNIGDSANRTARHDYARIYEKLPDRIIHNKKKQTNKHLNLTRSFTTYLTSNLT